MEVVDIQEQQPCKLPQVVNGTIHSNNNSNLINKDSEEEDEIKQLSKRVAGEGPEPAAGDGANRHHHQWHPSSRIIRVSRATGGKDRHSKVWTSKGLRDRRVRLSVGTAIQFYDLQDRLGFDQPSKAVEWLIEAASDAIAELPSLTGLLFDKEKQLPTNNNSTSFTELLTSAAATSAPENATPMDYSAASSRLGQGVLGQIQQDRVQHFSIGPENLNDYNLNFTIAGCNRGTLQSNISPSLLPYRQRIIPQLDGSNVPFFIGAAATAPVQLENHHQSTPALFDGNWQLHHSDQKGKGKN